MVPSRDYVVSVQHAPPRAIAAVHARLPIRDVSRVFGRYLDQVYAAARTGSVLLDGQNVFVYRPVTGRPDEADVAFGVGIRAPFAPVGNVQPTLVPGGLVAATTNWGSYANLGAAHHAVIEWCRAQGYGLAGSRWEVYGHWTDDESRLRTDVFYLLEPAASQAG